jgi:hypothetical protein
MFRIVGLKVRDLEQCTLVGLHHRVEVATDLLRWESGDLASGPAFGQLCPNPGNRLGDDVGRRVSEAL